MGNMIGLDIGTHAVRAVELSFGRSGPVMRRMGQVALNPGVVVAGEVVDAGAVSAALRRLWREVGFKDRSVVVGVANSRVVARMADLPAMTDDELRSSLRYQVQDLIPMPVEEAELDFQVVERDVGTDAEPKIRVMVVAAQKEMLASLQAALRAANLRPVSIDLNPFALVRTFHDHTAWMTAEPEVSGQEVIIGVGAGVTNVVVHDDGVPRFVRTLPMGGSAVTDLLADELGVERDHAELLKRDIGQEELPARARLVGSVSSLSLKPLVDEIASSLDFHLAQGRYGAPRRVVLTGGGARLPALQDLIEERLGVPVVIGDAYAGLDVSKVSLEPPVLSASADYFAVAVGLALSGATRRDSSSQVNLVSASVSAREVDRRQTVLAGVGVGAFAAALIGLAFVRGLHVDDARADAQRVEQKTASLEQSVAALHDIEQLQAVVATQTKTVGTVLQGDVAWPRVIEDVTAALPEDVWLTSFSATRGQNGQPGKVVVNATGADQTSAAHWLQRAAGAPSLANVWLTSSTKAGGATGASSVQISSDAELSPAAASDRLAHYTELSR